MIYLKIDYKIILTQGVSLFKNENANIFLSTVRYNWYLLSLLQFKK